MKTSRSERRVQSDLPKYSFGVGDRFAHQAKPQLRACMLAAGNGIEIVPVWNKSHREHMIVGSQPAAVRVAAEAAVRELGWNKPFFIDADHVTLATVDGFLESSDYYTLDVADAIGKPADAADLKSFVARHRELADRIVLRGVDQPILLSPSRVEQIAAKYLFACREAARVYHHIESVKGEGKFITEVSMDETDSPQTPAELLVILAALADAGVPVQAIAPKFTGRFNKGVDYVGNVEQFELEFRTDIAVLAKAVSLYSLPSGLKLSVHSGSDKFSIYPAIGRALRDFNAGIHVKTAGTTWLEEVIGLAESGGDALALAKEIYGQAYARREELCGPYASVIDIDPAALPAPSAVEKWTSQQYASALRHDQLCAQYSPIFRQLIHVGYKVAAQLGKRFLEALDAHEQAVSENVTFNLFERHLKPIFLTQRAFAARQ